MRRNLALAVLTWAMGAAGVPMCDSGCVVNAEERRLAPAGDDRIRRSVDHIYPPPVGAEQRTPVRGDFWSPQERDRAFPQDGNRSGFETIVPAR